LRAVSASAIRVSSSAALTVAARLRCADISAARAMRSSSSRCRQISLQPPLARSAAVCSAAVATVASAVLTACSEVSVKLRASRCLRSLSSVAWRLSSVVWATAWFANFCQPPYL
jgi:hypothetical protein